MTRLMLQEWKRLYRFSLALGGVVLMAGFLPQSTQAGVFNTSRFVMPSQFAFGLEPSILLASGSGLSANLRMTYGLNELMNVQAIVGQGSGRHQFRGGGGMVFDFFPDHENQPGIGIAANAQYMQITDGSRGEVVATPYIHKAIFTESSEIDPFFALPIGARFESGASNLIASLALGTVIKTSENMHWVVELGVAVNRTSSYFSGGFVFYN